MGGRGISVCARGNVRLYVRDKGARNRPRNGSTRPPVTRIPSIVPAPQTQASLSGVRPPAAGVDPLMPLVSSLVLRASSFGMPCIFGLGSLSVVRGL